MDSTRVRLSNIKNSVINNDNSVLKFIYENETKRLRIKSGIVSKKYYNIKLNLQSPNDSFS